MSFENYFPENFQVFVILNFFPGFSLFFPFESYSFQEFLKFSGLKVVLVGLLAMAWRLARCHLSAIFPEISQVFVI